MDMPTNDITVIDKLLLLIIAILVFGLSAITLTTNLAHTEYIRLEQNVREGRFVVSDITRLLPYTIHDQLDELPCNLKVRKTIAVLTLYASDLTANHDGIQILDRQGDFIVQIHRARAMARVREVLICAPLDGDMWLRLSLLSFILNMDKSMTNSFLAWSERTTPYETWIKNPRDAFVQNNVTNSDYQSYVEKKWTSSVSN